ncbi:EamA family transporter RarD [Enterococcus wangshanyuanii]|uniref:Permease n=2 Tax=Enterococcus wangshanyuanii TaxID=2005703 RepID=A0ABQ1P1Y5_9ENTE|nr:EamA family transporter RarD [Enterococcus wangshanyuanii]GGC87471.1 permease [Enterococcus wangshanyuanii]
MKEEKRGVLLGVIAYMFWGVIPIYWKLMPMVDPLDILCYRIVWSFLFMLIYIFATKKWTLFLTEVKSVLKEKKKLFAIICAAILISLNWFTFIYTVSQGHVTQASLGYYMNPLVNVLLATLILKEKLNRSGMIACGLALTGVILLTVQTGQLPLAPLVMAVTFSFYGLIKKGVTVSSYTGLTIETFVILPLALIYLVFFSKQGFMNYEVSTNMLLVGAGVVTAIPLLLFAEAAKKISYIILGFIQYVGPTLMLLSALFLYHEPYSAEQFMAFGCIWLGIAVFTYGNIYAYRKEKQFTK